jgi:hypothetical protein
MSRSAVPTNLSGVYSGYLRAPVKGPLSTNQYPGIIPINNLGVLNGIRPTPPQFYPMQEPVNADMNTNARAQYTRSLAYSVPEQFAARLKEKITSPVLTKHLISAGRSYPVSQNFNYIEPMQSSLYVNSKKAYAVGKSSYKVGLPASVPISTKSYFPTEMRTSLRRARSGGCTAPKKKGAIENYSLRNGQVCSWGSYVRTTY